MNSTQTATLGFKATPDLVERTDAAAKAEGLSRADIVRRALIRDLAAKAQQQHQENAA